MSHQVKTYPKIDRPHLHKNLSDHEMEGLKLNLGCGFHHLKDFVNVDNNPACYPTITWDLERTPWPWSPDNYYSYVCSINTLEHISNLFGVLGEVWRVCKPGARVEFIVPNCLHQAAFEDPTHVRFFGPSSSQYFDANTYAANTAWYTKDRFHFKPLKTGVVLDDFFDEDKALMDRLLKEGERPWDKQLINLVHRMFYFYCTGVTRYVLFQLEVVKPLPDLAKETIINVYE